MNRIKIVFAFAGLAALLGACSLTSPQLNQTITQYTQDTAAIHSYLKQNSIRATMVNAGIWFVVDSAASGIRAVFNDSIKIAYTTTLLSSGSVIEQSSVPLATQANSLVLGAQYAFPQFQAGSKGRIFIPGYYVNNGIGSKSITNAAPIIFSFKLLSVKDNQLKVDTATINTYIKNNSIAAMTDVSGIRYTLSGAGSGSVPSLTSNVTIDYTAKILSTGNVVDQGNSVNLNVSNLIIGMQIALLKMNEGTTCNLYVPSSLAYGPYQQGSIAGNSNMFFTIKLSKINSH
ncbi:MAG: FKBP-type peptidyl-prolyl cis-trans isomerase [Bacteroidetes bacterium]|nr:FKBP-type peptidyl-prolyl cis-trans isomerase [Bacteroidota bacterium]MBS1541594.1 FKBP-type peptidyl-prolyl cis-trans isomerase [Bacteroidota bacterium]